MGCVDSARMSHSLQPPASVLLSRIREEPTFRWSRRDIVAGGRGAARIIIGIGQQHGVGHGRFERFQARKIARVQAWIFDACRWLSTQGVFAFGQEGLSRPGEDAFYGRLPQNSLAELQREFRHPEDVRSFLRKTSLQWRKALRRNNENEVHRTLQGLNALNLLQAIDEHIVVFPIEQRDVHGPLSQQITQLHGDIERIEHLKEYQSAISKGGKGLHKGEYDAVVQRNALIRAYNAALAHGVRNESIFEEVLREAQRNDETVFVLGQAHRSAILKLAKKHLPSDTVFVWITPKPLWKPILVRRFVYLLTGMAIGYTLWRVF